MAKKSVALAPVTPVPAQVAPKVVDPAVELRAKWKRRLVRWQGKADAAQPGLAAELMKELIAN